MANWTARRGPRTSPASISTRSPALAIGKTWRKGEQRRMRIRTTSIRTNV
jgi:hypothetical protein